MPRLWVRASPGATFNLAHFHSSDSIQNSCKSHDSETISRDTKPPVQENITTNMLHIVSHLVQQCHRMYIMFRSLHEPWHSKCEEFESKLDRLFSRTVYGRVAVNGNYFLDTQIWEKNMFIMYASILSSLLGQSTSTTSHLMSFLSRHIGKNLLASHSQPLQSSTVMSSQPVKLTGHWRLHLPLPCWFLFLFMILLPVSNTLLQICGCEKSRLPCSSQSTFSSSWSHVYLIGTPSVDFLIQQKQAEQCHIYLPGWTHEELDPSVDF